jgi:hypothetical protein
MWVLITVAAILLISWPLAKFVIYCRLTPEQRWKRRYDASLKKNYKYL